MIFKPTPKVVPSATKEPSRISSRCVDDLPLLRVEALSKRFAGLSVLDQIDFELLPGEVHALFGENGAGKSTLIQILSGNMQPTTGRIFLNGESLKIRSVRHARELGISVVFQEFSLIPQMSVEDNLFLGSEITRGPFLDTKRLKQSARQTLERLGFDIDPNKKVVHLSRAEQQMVEIAKAFRDKAAVMILDEPTASLTEREVEQLFSMIDKLRREGTGIIYITHRLQEIYRLCERVTVLRDGRCLYTGTVDDVDEKDLVEKALGRHVDELVPVAIREPGRLLLDVNKLRTSGKVFRDVSLQVRSGEVVGVAGLVGSGKSELGRACFGLQKVVGGEIAYLDDIVYSRSRRINDITPRAMLDRGLYYLPQNRRMEGLVMHHNMRENVSLPSLGLAKFSSGFLLNRQRERDVVVDVAQRLGMPAMSVERRLDHLSGGNQQKVMVAKSLVRDVRLFILDEPTVGVDVGARAAIYQLIHDVVEAGAGVLLISSDVSEISHVTHRCYVMHRGRILNHIDHGEIEESALRDYLYKQWLNDD